MSRVDRPGWWTVLLLSAWGWTLTGAARADDSEAIPRVLPAGSLPQDVRLGEPRKYEDAYHPWVPPATREAWTAARERLRLQLLVSQGLWPMPPATPLEPVHWGLVERDDYTIEKVYFESWPGHYVTGNLYRPRQLAGTAPGVLCPYGHWPKGRFQEVAGDVAQKQIDIGAERFASGAKHPLQARMVGLARLGCVVFHYDMVGIADSQQTPHRQGFTDVEAELRLQNFMGLQTYNSLRALDFLTSLPEVDTERIGVTGASGGGTQTFVLCGIDPRPTVAFPAVMVGTGMQGGCVCENASWLRVDINNIALAALFAPKPLAMSGADDWTKDIETKGLPELKQIYGFYDASELVHAKCFPQFEHNYNQHAREMMYAWFNKHLQLGRNEPIVERDFQPTPPAELSVFDREHVLPADAVGVGDLKKYLTFLADAQLASLLPENADDVAEYRRVIGGAAQVFFGDCPALEDVEESLPVSFEDRADGRLLRLAVTRSGLKEQVPVIALLPRAFHGTAVIWIDGRGKGGLFQPNGQPLPEIDELLRRGWAVVSADVFQTGEYRAQNKPFVPVVNATYPGFTFGYNRPLLAQRVHDILTLVGGLRKWVPAERIHLVGTGEAGPWCLLAKAACGDRVADCIVDLEGFGFTKVHQPLDPMLLPGALKYGGIGGLGALAAPGRLVLCGTKYAPPAELAPLIQVYRATQGRLQIEVDPLTPARAVGYLE